MEYSEEKNAKVTVMIKPKGPVTILGDFEAFDEEGNKLEKREKLSICRCGASAKMPYCDGAHKALQGM